MAPRSGSLDEDCEPMHEGLREPIARIQAVVEEAGGAEKLAVLVCLMDLDTGGCVTLINGQAGAVHFLVAFINRHFAGPGRGTVGAGFTACPTIVTSADPVRECEGGCRIGGASSSSAVAAARSPWATGTGGTGAGVRRGQSPAAGPASPPISDLDATGAETLDPGTGSPPVAGGGAPERRPRASPGAHWQTKAAVSPVAGARVPAALS